MNKTANLLSVVIPVYNFDAFLPQCLESLLDESLDNNVEILVFDGCSTDNTQLIVKAYQQKHQNLRYIKALSKGGIDLDIVKSVELVNSKYCWLFSGDDVAKRRSIVSIIEIIKNSSPDMILCRHNECSFDMNIIKDWPVLNIHEDRIFHLHDEKDQSDYLSLALTSEAFFTFMGGLIIKRETWLKGILNNSLDGSCWAHVGRLWSLTKSDFKIYYVHQTLLNRRGGNDSFSDKGMLNRLKIQIDGLLNVLETIFEKESHSVINLKRVIRNEVYPDWVQSVISDLDALGASPKMYAELENLLNKIDIKI